jgi:hypothetical protein
LIVCVKAFAKGTAIKERNTTLICCKSLGKMTEEPNKQEPAPPEKLLIDDPSDFQFHAAYLVYSELFDNAKKLEIKRELNENIETLRQNKISHETFYRNVDRYRKESRIQRQDRVSFQTQRKREWRKKAQKQERIRRHRK